MPIFYDVYNPKAVMLHAYLQEYVTLRDLDEHLHVVVGGDGFMLKTVREHESPDAVFLGLNCGRLGFLLNPVPEDMARLAGLIRSDHLHVYTFPRIKMEAFGQDQKKEEARALNDIYLERMTGQSCHLRILIDGTEVVREIVCDGLILCTALGSTAYNFSAGGAVCHPTLPVIGITPICPHVPKLSPLVFPSHARIYAEVLQEEKRKVRAVADGVDYNEIRSITVSDAQSPVKLAFFPDHEFTGTLVSKVLNT